MEDLCADIGRLVARLRWGSRVGQAVGRFFGNSAILIKFYLPMVSISFLLLLVRHLLLLVRHLLLLVRHLLLLVRHLLLLVRHLLLLASCLNSIYLLFLIASCYY